MVGLQAKSGGVWKDGEPWVKVSGVWQKAAEVHAKSGGVWTKVWPTVNGNDEFTVLLIHPRDTIEDSSASAHSMTVTGSPTIVSSPAAFGETSIRFPGGATRYIQLDGSSDFAFGTGDFTIDFRIWLAAVSSSVHTYFYESRPSLSNGLYPLIYCASSSRQLRFHTNSADRITGPALDLNTEYHIALTRSGTSTRLFLNGSQVGSTYSDSNNYLGGGVNRPLIGCGANASGDNNYWLQELRVSKGIARWTSNFTPPTQPYS